ncbi:hypothetical protein MTR_2g046050 [Medicago truncatula]|uniref:Uncharacterized protein n=1 Tax=Medicago truncatula TaxID=3880 RepID=A0A072V6M4_MEDTR|nr:hypothetical protein MTR_2g046050 [Medicago truncatula]
MRSKTKGNELCVMDVKVLATSNQNVLRISRNRKRGCLSLGQMMIPSSSLDKDESGKSISEKEYRGMIGSFYKHVTVFTGRCESDEDYNEEICLQGEKQKKIIVRMHIEKEKPISTILGLQDEVTLLTSKVDDNMIKYVIMLNTGSDMLDDIVQVGKGSGNLTGKMKSNYDTKIFGILISKACRRSYMRKPSGGCLNKKLMKNHVTLRSSTSYTLYELWKGRKPTVKYFHVFGTYKVINSKTNTMMESINVVVDDSTVEKAKDVEDEAGTSFQQLDSPEDVSDIESNIESDSNEVQVNKGPYISIQKDQLKDLII